MYISMTECWLVGYLELSPPKPLDQSNNVTVRTFHSLPRIVHEHIFLVLWGARGPRRHVARAEGPYVVRYIYEYFIFEAIYLAPFIFGLYWRSSKNLTT